MKKIIVHHLLQKPESSVFNFNFVSEKLLLFYECLFCIWEKNIHMYFYLQILGDTTTYLGPKIFISQDGAC